MRNVEALKTVFSILLLLGLSIVHCQDGIDPKDYIIAPF